MYDTAFEASPTSSYVDHLNRRAGPDALAGIAPVGIVDGQVGEVEAAEVAAGINEIRALPGQRGVLIGLGGGPAFVELFASPTGLRRHLPGLLEAALIDAVLLPV